MNLLPLLNHPELKNEIVINRAEVIQGGHSGDEIRYQRIADRDERSQNGHSGDEIRYQRFTV